MKPLAAWRRAASLVAVAVLGSALAATAQEEWEGQPIPKAPPRAEGEGPVRAPDPARRHR